MANTNRRKLNEAEEPVLVETPATQESTHSVAQLINEYKAFHCNRDLVVVALKLSGKEEMTFSEAERIIEDFKNKEVR